MTHLSLPSDLIADVRLMWRAHGRYDHPDRDIDVTVRALMQRVRANHRRAQNLFVALWVLSPQS
jgi:hypothetical protein